jgi:hypothetical protein
VTAQNDYRVIGGGLAILVIVAIGLGNEFHEARQTSWNVFLAAIVIGPIVAAVLGQPYFRAHVGKIGEAYFDTRNEDQK